MLLAVEHRLEHNALELAELRGDRRLGQATHELLVLAPVADEIGDGDEQQPVLVGEALELRCASHVHLLLVDDLTEHAGGVQARETGEVDRGFGVAGPLEHAALARFEGEDVAGAGQVVRSRCRIDQRADRGRPVERADTGRRSVEVVD